MTKRQIDPGLLAFLNLGHGWKLTTKLMVRACGTETINF